MSFPCRSTQTVVANTLMLPENKPSIDQLLRLTTRPYIDKALVVDRGIMFSGHLLLFVEYAAHVANCSQPIHFVCFEIPFQDVFDHCCARIGMNVRLVPKIKLQELTLLTPRSMEEMIVLKIYIDKLTKGECPPTTPECESVMTLCSPQQAEEECASCSVCGCKIENDTRQFTQDTLF